MSKNDLLPEISLTMVNKETGEKKKYNFENHSQLKDFIANIKTYDLTTHDAFVNYSKGNAEFFKRTYNKKFYVIDEALDLIELKVLPNGVSRHLTYNVQRPNFNRTLKNTLKRIEKDLKKEMKKINFEFEFYSEDLTEDRYHYIKITLDDLINHDSRKTQCVIKFDKLLWTYEILEIKTTRLKEVYHVIKKVFEQRTASTRNYRRKKYDANNA